MADLRILLLVSLLSLPLSQGEEPCLDELYVEGCPSYLFRSIKLSFMDTARTVFIEPKEISEITLRSGTFHQPVNITTRHQIRLWKNGSELSVDGPGIQTKKWENFNNYLEIASNNPLWFSLDCINASHSCRFHRLSKVNFVSGENGLVTWRPEDQAIKLLVGVLGAGQIDYKQPVIGQRSYDITIRGSSEGPPCGISCPSLNMDFMSATFCGQLMSIISVNKVGDHTWSYFDFSALVPKHPASGPPEDVPTALASPSSISTVDGDKASKTFPLLVCAREGMLRRPAKGIFGFECDLGCWQTPTVVAETGQGYLVF